MTMSNQNPNFLLRLIENFLKCFVMITWQHIWCREAVLIISSQEQISDWLFFQQGLALSNSQLGQWSTEYRVGLCPRLQGKAEAGNHLHPCSSMYILPTPLYTFSKVPKRRICSTIRSFFSISDHFLHSGDLNVWFRGDTEGRN